MPAATPPSRRARTSTSTDGAKAATSENGMASAVPAISIILRPYRSPSAPSQSTDVARPSE
jgi:hypothetical protein